MLGAQLAHLPSFTTSPCLPWGLPPTLAVPLKFGVGGDSRAGIRVRIKWAPEHSAIKIKYFYNSFIERKFTYHVIYLFKIYSAFFFSVFIGLCSRHHSLI